MQIEWAPTAIRDVQTLLSDAHVDGGRTAAQDAYDQIQRAALDLARKDAVSRILPELRETGLFHFRELALDPISIFFRMTRTKISILGVLDRRRDLRQLLFRRLVHAGARGEVL